MRLIILAIFFVSVFSCKQNPTYKNLLETDVVFLADDKLEGRQTGTDGEIAASNYIVKRFKEIGLQPKGAEGFLQPFSFKPKTDPHKEV